MRALVLSLAALLAMTAAAAADPIHGAAKAGDVAKVQELLAGGAAVDARDGHGRTPLYWASGEGHTEVAKVLLAAGAAPICS